MTNYVINGKVFHKIKPEYSQAAADWYRGKIFTKDEIDYQQAEEGEIDRGIVEIVEDAINKYDCRFIVIDNLMTAIADNLDTDKYREQGVFMKSLTRIAQKYQVFVMLVAHPRKTDGRKLMNDDVAGTGDITNLASVVLGYVKPPLGEGEDPTENAKRRKLTILKNRLTGDIDEEGIELYYDAKSKRISEYDSHFDLNVNLIMPDSEQDPEEARGFMNIPEDEEVPF